MSKLVSISKTLQLKKGATISEYTIWSKRYKAMARTEKFADVMLGKETRPTTRVESVVASSSTAAVIGNAEEYDRITKANDDGYTHLMLSVLSEKDVDAVYDATTTEYDTGCVKTAWENLAKNYKPKTIVSKTKLIKTFYEIELNKMEYPPDLFMAGMIRIQSDLLNLHSYDVPNIDFTSHILNGIRHEYDSAVSEFRVQNLNGTDVDLQIMTSRMREQFDLYWKRKNKDSKKIADKFSFDKLVDGSSHIHNDKGLSTKMKGKKFKGNCDLCGKQGHKKKDCWELEENKNKRPKGWKSCQNQDEVEKADNANLTQGQEKCPICGKMGHTLERCFYNPFNPKNKLKNTELVDRVQEDAETVSDESAMMVTEKFSNEVNKNELCRIFPDLTEEEIDETVWIADTGASTHMYKGKKGFSTTKKNTGKVEVGDGNTTDAPLIGMWHGTHFCGNNLHNIKFGKTLQVPNLKTNLCSLTQAMNNGCTIHGENDVLTVKKHNKVIKFDRKIKTKNGYVLAGIIKPAESKKGEVLMVIEDNEKANDMEIRRTPILSTKTKCSLQHAHDCFMHAHDGRIRATCSKYGIQASGNCRNCEDCAISKAKKTPVKGNVVMASEPSEDRESFEIGEKFSTDISNANARSTGKNKYWNLTVDYKTNCNFSIFLRAKKHLSNKLLRFIKNEVRAKQNYKGNRFRLDNAGENVQFETDATDGSLGIHFEFTAADTPQQNAIVERQFATLWGMIRASMRKAGMNKNKKLKNKLWSKCANMATDVFNILVDHCDDKCPFEKYFGKMPKWFQVSKLRPFGWICIVTKYNKILAKLDDRGKIGLMVGYCTKNGRGTYRIFMLKSERVVLTKDVRWLGLYYGEWLHMKSGYKVDGIDVNPDPDSSDDEDDVSDGSIVHPESEDDSDDSTAHFNKTNSDDDTSMSMMSIESEDSIYGLEGSSDEGSINDEDNNTRQNSFSNRPSQRAERYASRHNDSPEIPRTNRVIRALRKLETSYNPTMDNATMNMDISLACLKATDEYGFQTSITSGYVEPSSYKQMMKRNEPERTKWLKGCDKELKNMKLKDVWTIISIEDLPSGRRLLKCKWVFKLKRDGTHRSRLVAMGFSQIPGVDFTDSFAPVVSDVTLRILLILKMIFGWDTKVIDVEQAFLYGHLDKEIYMEIPEGLKAPPKSCLQLKKSIYGLVQASRTFWETFSKHLKTKNFKVSRADSCLFIRQTEQGICIFILYVDDALLFGDNKAIDFAVKDIKTAFTISTNGTLKDYLGAKITVDQQNKTTWITQPDLLDKMFVKYGSELSKRNYKTPGTPGFVSSLKSIQDKDVLSTEQMERYRSGVGMLLYLQKLSRPDLSNPVRELSKCLTKATIEHYNEMLRIMRFVQQTKRKGLKLQVKTAMLQSKHILGKDEILWYLSGSCDAAFASDKDKRLSVSGFIVKFLGAPVSWRSRLQRAQTLSSTESEYVAIADVVKELLYLRNILRSLGFVIGLPMIVEVDNIGAIYLTRNASSSVRTRHVDLQFHFVREFYQQGILQVVFVNTTMQQSDIMTKNVNPTTYDRHAATLLGIPKTSN